MTEVIVERQTIVTKDEWLTQLLERDVYRFNFDLNWEMYLRVSVRYLKRPLLIYAEVPTDEIEKMYRFEVAGFKLIGTNVTFSKSRNPDTLPRSWDTEMKICLAKAEDEESSIRVARMSFMFGRFHLDPTIDQKMADKVKAEWVRNYFKGKRGDQMVVALQGKEVIGFLQLLKRPKKLIYDDCKDLIIDQIAVLPSERRKGIAVSMIRYAEQINEDCDRIVVGTQISNIPSIRLYEKLGFQLTESKYVFHYHG